jgi:phage terminase small subunit
MAIPKHLSKEMKAFYRKIEAEYDLEEFRKILLTRSCELFDLSEKARKEIAEGKLTEDGAHGKRANPLVKVQIDSASQARLLLREIGLDLESPASNNSHPPRLRR